MKWWIAIVVAIVVLTGLFFVGGVYAGGWFFLLINQEDYTSVSWHTLLDAAKLTLDDERLVYLPWAWCVTAAVTFLPIGTTLLAFLMRFKQVSSLHGDARFATNRELKQFEYKGEYQ
ncbi:hypothetical protein [Pseudomonas fluorescens]|uniref:Transmembrane protein n=1 Tax=Pseudomonas fluorescens TaxID=294 RepID=A0A2T0HN10_PSEFL|nr:hypothetical protein [Pseudomonas fluorescens]PRW84484.1 hypothetical protein C7A10_29055 [Pseudomonas fluorescens]